MKIKNKIALATMSILVVIIIVVNLSFALYFQKFITRQENEKIASANDNIGSFLDERTLKYLGNANDWGHWTDTHDFLNGDYPEYVCDNLPEDTFINLDISFMILTDENGFVFYKQFFSFENEEFTGFPADFLDNFAKIIDYSKKADDISGVFQIGSGFYFVAATDITDNEMENTNGKLFIGRSVEGGIIGSLENITCCSLVSMDSVSGGAGGGTTGITYLKNRRSIDIKSLVLNKYDNEDSVMFGKKFIHHAPGGREG
jgi:sensor domain CHASE-containing protein